MHSTAVGAATNNQRQHTLDMVCAYVMSGVAASDTALEAALEGRVSAVAACNTFPSRMY